MTGPHGPVGVPYSKVETAKQQNYALNGQGEYDRYAKDYNADPHAPSQGADFSLSTPVHAAVDSAKGFLKSAAQVPNTVVGWLDSLTDDASGAVHGPEAKAESQKSDIRPKLEALEEKVAPGITHAPHGAAQESGGVGEQLLEWLYGEGEGRAALEALPMAKRLSEASKAAAMFEKFPVLAKAVKTFAGGAGQQLAHGASPKEAATAGGAGAVLAGTGEALTQAQLRAEMEAQLAADHAAAPAVLDERTAAMGAQRQAEAQGNIKGVVGKATQNAMDRFNAAGAAAPGFAPVTVDPTQLSSFGEGAAQVKAAARPIYQRVDGVDGYNGQLENLQGQYKQALDNFDYKAADKAEIAIDDLLNTKPGDVHPAEQAAAKIAWRDAKVMDKLHAATEGAFNGISERRATVAGTGTRALKPGSSDTGALSPRLNQVMSTPAKAKEVYRVIGQEGVANLDRASALVSKPALENATADLAEEVAKQFPAPVESKALGRTIGVGLGSTAGAAIGHATGIPGAASAGAVTGGAAGGLLSDGARNVMRKMVTSPRVGQLMDYAVRNNVTPKLAAQIVAAEIRQEQGQEQPK